MSADDPTVSALLLDRYLVEGTLGEGGIGSVVRAFDQRLRRTVAIKSLKRSLASIEPAQLFAIEDRFSREAIAGSRMGSHPNLVAVYDLTAGPDETLYLILEFVAGGTYFAIGRDGSATATPTPEPVAAVLPIASMAPTATAARPTSTVAAAATAAAPLPTVTATATLRPTATLGPTNTPIALPTFSPRAVTADMNDPNQWNTINVELSNRTLTNNSYTVRVLKRPDGRGLLSWGDWVPTTTKLAPQFAAEVEMSIAGDPANSTGGMLFLFNNTSRGEEQQFLLFLLRGDGRFSVMQQFPGGEGHNVARIDWTPSGAIKTGANAANVPRIVVRAGALTCGVNGQQILQMPVPAEVATFNAFALAADILKESAQPEASVTFRNLRYEPFSSQ